MEERTSVLLINENLKNRKLNDLFQTKEKVCGKPDFSPHIFIRNYHFIYIKIELLSFNILNQI